MAHFEAFASVLVLILLVLLVRGPWKTVCTDYARQIMFECRDSIFDLAWEGKISFDSAAYKESRLGIERNIRFAHELSVGRLLFFLPRLIQTGDRLSTERALDSVSDENLKMEIKKQIATSQRVLLIMMVAKSPLLCILGVLLLALSKASEILRVKRRDAEMHITRIIQSESDNDPTSGLNSPRAA